MKRRHHIANLLKNFFTIKLIHRPQFKNKNLVLQKWYTPSKPDPVSEEPTITWIGQATFLIQFKGLNILTDPIFFQPSFFFPRLVPPGIALEHLPSIDVILISHNHNDHMDKKSLLKLKHHNAQIFVPHGVGKWFLKHGFQNITEHHWGDKQTITTKTNQQITCTFLPATHWSGNNFFNINKSKHGSWMIEHNDYALYFAGDTAYTNHFIEIGQNFSNIKVALLPISPVEPRHMIAHAHIDGEQAIKAFLDLKAEHFIPMHWGTFQLGAEEFEVPIKLLQNHWKKQQEVLQNKQLHIVKFGEAKKLS